MPAPTLIEAHVAVTQAGRDEFVNTNPPWTPPPGTRAIFGGFLLGQSVSAANHTVDASFSVYSLQSFFLRSGSHKEKIVYQVDRLTDGRNFATRQVRASQGGKCIYMAVVGYQKADEVLQGKSLSYGLPMPDMGNVSPADAALLRENHPKMIRYLAGNQELAESLDPDPFEWLIVQWEGEKEWKPIDFRFRGFVRAPALSRDDKFTHSAALAFLTDEWFLLVPQLATPGFVDVQKGTFPFNVTMNHSVHFHNSAHKISDWMVCERTTSWADKGRVVVENRFWDAETGRLVVSCSQEGVVLSITMGSKL